ncbi:hypothetical protein DV736_g2207, partial [Chaetothyriales sp. CBS 134916]
MLSLQLFFSACLALVAAKPVQRDESLGPRDTAKTPVSSDEYANMVYYAQFPMSGQSFCTTPPSGIVEQQYFDITETATQAAIFRIDSRKEFVLAIPGTKDTQDYLTDADFFFTEYNALGGVSCDTCLVFSGFQIAWDSLSGQVEEGLRNALGQYPDYTVSISGHSLGAGISELAFSTLRPQSFNISALYTYGAPRVGNKQFADYIDSLSGASDTSPGIYRRITHYNDPIPALPPSFLGYVHPRSEYWESTDSPSLVTTYQCCGQEPSDCINSIPPATNLDAHSDYAGMKDFC